MIPNTNVDIITQNATAQMLCRLRTGISFYESLKLLKSVLGCIFLIICVSLPGIQILDLNTLLMKGEDSTNCQL